QHAETGKERKKANRIRKSALVSKPAAFPCGWGSKNYKLFQKHDLPMKNGSMSTRHELTDEQWAVIEHLLPKPKPGPGRPPDDPRITLNGILYVLIAGCSWAEMPRQYGSATTCWRGLEQWSEDGTWERIWRALLSRMDAEEKIEWSQAFLDGRFVPAKKG